MKSYSNYNHLFNQSFLLSKISCFYIEFQSCCNQPHIILTKWGKHIKKVAKESNIWLFLFTFSSILWFFAVVQQNHCFYPTLLFKTILSFLQQQQQHFQVLHIIDSVLEPLVPTSLREAEYFVQVFNWMATQLKKLEQLIFS